MMKSGYRVYFATAAVFLGAGIISLAQRLLSVGLPDLRGALGLGFDEAAWIPTACDMGLMFMGPLTVYLGGIVGARRVLLFSAPIYALSSFAIPFTRSYSAIIALQVITGLSAGTFYPLSLSYGLANLPPKYAIYGIGAFSMELMTTLSVGTPLQAWFGQHWSDRWIFWAGPALSLVMMLLVYIAIPDRPKRSPPTVKPSFTGFLYASVGLSLIFGALEQGERLDWLHSRTIVALLVSGGTLLAAACFQRAVKPNPLVNLRFLLRRNALILGVGLFSFRFALLSILVLIPGFLGAVQGYRPHETGRVLLWSVLPLALGGFVATSLMRRLDARMVAALGFALIGVSTLINARLTSVWVAEDFFVSQLVVAVGLACALVGVIGMNTQHLQATGAVGAAGVIRPADVLTYASYFQTVRLFGGQVGVSVVQRFVDLREMFHSNRLGYNLQLGDFTTDERLRALATGVLPASPGLDGAQGQAVTLLSAQVRGQAYTLAYADGFLLVAAACVGFMLFMSLMKPMKVYFDARASGLPQ
jgi:MFS transporter, DHA2 family, multidrug resistance protein